MTVTVTSGAESPDTDDELKAIFNADRVNVVETIPDSFKYLYASYHLKCTEEGSNKFWSIYAVTDSLTNPSGVTRDVPRPNGRVKVLLRWGKVGLAGQTEVKSFVSPADAARYIEGRLKDKTKKGYRTTLAKYAIGFRTRGASPVASPRKAATQSFAWDL